MKESLLPLLACPACQHPLTLIESEVAYDEIWRGRLLCANPNQPHSYTIQNGMPLLYVNDEAWAPKAKEAQGWVELIKSVNGYEPPEDAPDLYIPYWPHEPWLGVARTFDYALSRLNLTGRETVLDLGAGLGWAAKQFALKGCQVVALDVVTDVNVGLGRAKAIMSHAGTYFDRIIGDGEQLPFQPGQFDLVFCSAALHHSTDLGRFMHNISQVLKPGGRLCAIYEPCISILADEQQMLAEYAQDELNFGINETRPNVYQYYQALTQNGLKATEMTPAVCFHQSEPFMVEFAQQIGAIRPPLMWWAPRPTYNRLKTYLNKRWQAYQKGLSQAQKIPAEFNTHHQKLNYAILQWYEHEIFILAQK